MCARHPLPEAVPDALMNKAQLEMALGVSQTTISNWLRQGLPFEEAGTNGRSYVFRLAVAHAWVQARRADDDAARAHGDRAAAQMQLALLGGETATPADGRLSLTDQRKLLELELQRMQAARLRGDLLRREDVVTLFEDVFAAIRDGLDALPDRIAREIGAEGRDLEAIEAVCDAALAQAAAQVREVIGDDESSGD